MKQGLFSLHHRRAAFAGLLTAIAACCAASPALATTTAAIDTSACSAPTISQALLRFGDVNWYSLLPGESPDALTGAGWTLRGGASIKSSTLADGQMGPVLDLPSGSTAVSPTICVNNSFPTARTEVRDVIGSEGVQFSVSYAGTRTWTSPQTTGHVHGTQSAWTLSNDVHLKPGNTADWQLVRFTFVPGGKHGDFQIYDFYVDPRCRG
jgi:hypothetical protein